MRAFIQDLRVASRALLKSRAFTATAVLTLALGMTLCTAAVAVMKAYLLQDLPYPAADRLYAIRYAPPGQPGPRGMEALDWEALGDVIEFPVAWDLDAFSLLGGEHAETVMGAWVTPGFVQGLGIAPAFGRGFDAASFKSGSENVALISHRLWRARFAADPNIVGRTFSAYVSDRPQEAERFTIIGVLPANFWHINGYTDVLAPLRAPTYPYMVRLRQGVSPAGAAQRIATLVRGGAQGVPPDWNPVLVSTHEQYVERTRPLLQTASAAAALVLLVACANVAALLLVRAVGRQKEIAVRTALGARRSAVARMLLAEALLLGTGATAIAFAASAAALRFLAPLVQQQLGRPAPGGAAAFGIDATAVGFVVLIGFVTAIVCTVAPLATTWRVGFQQALHGSGRASTEAPTSRRLRSTLIAVEVALSLTLLAGSTLMLRTVVALLRTDLGFSSERVLLGSVTLRQNRYPDPQTRLAMAERIEARVGSVPGVTAVGLTTAWPVQQPQLRQVETVRASDRARAQSGVHRVNPSYFAAVEMRLAEGRLLSNGDRFGGQPVAVVSESLARHLWPDGRAVGARLLVPEDGAPGQLTSVERAVVGVVRDVRQGPSDDVLADVYTPISQSPGRFLFVLTRTDGAPAGWVSAFRQAFREIDPEIAVQAARPLQVIVDDLVARPRFIASLLAAFALIAGALALVGVYGVVAYAVRQREREIAVRMALGADPSRLTRLFVRQGAGILLAGLLLGLVGSIAAGRIIESQLFGVTPRDPLALSTAAAAFAAAGLLAIWWPSRRAAGTDPAVALRQE